jgi:predicted small secreted protein
MVPRRLPVLALQGHGFDRRRRSRLEKYMTKAALTLIALLALAACNTMQGMGEDVSTAGDAISDNATEAEQGM